MQNAFCIMEIFWRVVRPLRLLSQIAMTLRMSARTYNVIYSRIKIYCGPSKSSHSFPKGSPYHISHSKWVSNCKNGLSDAFWSVEIDWDVVRSHRLLSRIAYDLRMSARTYNVIPSCLRNFFEALEDPHLISENSIFADFASKMLWIDLEIPKITREVRLGV